MKKRKTRTTNFPEKASSQTHIRTMRDFLLVMKVTIDDTESLIEDDNSRRTWMLKRRLPS